MNTSPLATVTLPTLADAVDEALAAGLAGLAEPCLWCGAPAPVVVKAEFWSGRVTVRCPDCGSELEGVAPRRLREVPR